MEDLQTLKQKVEFLEFQLADFQQKEKQYKGMYESLLEKLATTETEEPVSPVSTPVVLSPTNQSEVDDLRSKLREAQEVARDLEFNLRNQKLLYEQSLLDANKRILRLESEKNHLNWKAKQLASPRGAKRQRDTKGLRGNLRKLKSHLNALKAGWGAEVTAMQSLCAESLTCMKEVYDEQHQRLKTHNSTLQQTIRELQSDSPDLSRHSESNPHSAQHLRDLLREKSVEVEQLQRILLQKSSEQRGSLSCKECHSLLETRTRQVMDLKRQAGELRMQLNSPSSMKPPSPLHSRALSQSPRGDTVLTEPPMLFSPPEELRQLGTFRRMLSNCSKMQCLHCRSLVLPVAFNDHILTCRLEALQDPKSPPDEEKSRLSMLKIKLGQLRNERDRARLEAERLLLQLKSVKLDWALTEERQNERAHQLRLTLKQVLQALTEVRAKGSHSQLETALLLLRELCLCDN